MKNNKLRYGLIVLAMLLVIAWALGRKPAANLKKPVAVCGKTN